MAAPDFTCDLDLTDDELIALLDLATEIKRAPREFGNALSGKSVALLFEKPSLRTRFTFELAAQQMGGTSVFMDGPIGAREPVQDVARNLDRWVHAIVARTFLQATVDQLAKWSSVPVVNALSELYHPCQALADMLTIREHWGTFPGRKLVFIGDGNNVAHSLMLSAARLGMDFALAAPSGYAPDRAIVAKAETIAARHGATVQVGLDAHQAVARAHAVYTDVWASMGQESEAVRRRAHFAAYQVNESLLHSAAPDAIFMHCLPAHRGEEVTDGVMEAPRSVVFDQAENRLHVQKALLLMLIAGEANRS